MDMTDLLFRALLDLVFEVDAPHTAARAALEASLDREATLRGFVDAKTAAAQFTVPRGPQTLGRDVVFAALDAEIGKAEDPDVQAALARARAVLDSRLR